MSADARDARDRAGDFKPWFYAILRHGTLPLYRFVFRMRVRGIENVPATGGAIVASMHRSNFDAFVVGIPIPGRHLCFMAKAELYRPRLLAWVLRSGGAFKVERGKSDAAAVQHAIDLARAGELVAIYPEGTRNRAGKKPHSGAARIAITAGVPMIPVAVKGTDRVRLWPPRIPRFESSFGPALETADLADMDLRHAARALTERWIEAIDRLLSEMDRG